MARTLTLSVAASLILFAGTASAQSLALRDAANVPVPSGTTIVACTDAAALELQHLPLLATNISNTQRTFNVKRYEFSSPHGSQNYFCWSLCYGAVNGGTMPFWVSEDVVELAAGAEFNGFTAYYDPVENEGSAAYRYVWYDVANENDSVWVDILFYATPTGIVESSGARQLSIAPNPANGPEVTLSFDGTLDPARTQVVVYNALGERLRSRSLVGTAGRSVLPIGDLPTGVWYIALEDAGRKLATRRLVVTR